MVKNPYFCGFSATLCCVTAVTVFLAKCPSGLAQDGYIQPPSHGPLPCALERGKRPAGRVCGGFGGRRCEVSAVVVRQQAAGSRAPVRQTWPRSWPVRRDCCARAAGSLCTSGGCCVESLPCERKAELSPAASIFVRPLT